MLTYSTMRLCTLVLLSTLFSSSYSSSPTVTLICAIPITHSAFNCVFPSAISGTYSGLVSGAQQMGWSPTNTQELAAFYGHVKHETDGLKTLSEYCGSGSCANSYNNPSWCPNVKPVSGQTYFGRGFLQLSWPCNYKSAGDAIHMNLLANPGVVASDTVVAAKTGIWFWQTQCSPSDAAQGWFSRTTNKINGKLECHGGSPSQITRYGHYQEARKCLGLQPETNMAKLSCAGGVSSAEVSDIITDDDHHKNSTKKTIRERVMVHESDNSATSSKLLHLIHKLENEIELINELEEDRFEDELLKSESDDIERTD